MIFLQIDSDKLISIISCVLTKETECLRPLVYSCACAYTQPFPNDNGCLCVPRQDSSYQYKSFLVPHFFFDIIFVISLIKVLSIQNIY